MSASLVGRTVRITGGDLASIWDGDTDHVIAIDESEKDGTVQAVTNYGVLWIYVGGGERVSLAEILSGVVLPHPNLGTVDELDTLPVGSIVTTPFPDIEGNVAERVVDGWLTTGEADLLTTGELYASADRPITVLRRGYGDES